MKTLFEDIDLEEVYNKANDIEQEEKEEPKDDTSDDSKKTLSELAALLYAFGNDVRILHLYTSGEDFKTYHETLNDLYDILFDAYDTTAEMAISHDEKIVNPAKVLEVCTDWTPIEGEKFTTDTILKEVDDRGNKVLDAIKNIKEYESFVQSNVDDFTGQIDKIVNYIFKQSAK